MDLSYMGKTNKSAMEENKVGGAYPIKRSVSWEYKLNQNSFDPAPFGSPPEDLFLNKLMARKSKYFSTEKKLNNHSSIEQNN